MQELCVEIGGSELIIEHITYPYAFTDDGYRIPINDIKGNPKIGSEIIATTTGYHITSSTSDSVDCPTGVCPIK